MRAIQAVKSTGLAPVVGGMSWLGNPVFQLRTTRCRQRWRTGTSCDGTGMGRVCL